MGPLNLQCVMYCYQTAKQIITSPSLYVQKLQKKHYTIYNHAVINRAQHIAQHESWHCMSISKSVKIIYLGLIAVYQ